MEMLGCLTYTNIATALGDFFQKNRNITMCDELFDDDTELQITISTHFRFFLFFSLISDDTDKCGCLLICLGHRLCHLR